MRDIGAGLGSWRQPPRGRARDRRGGRASCATLQEQVAPRVRELREMDDWRRFANAQRQEQLIAMAEAIVASLKSDEEAGKDVRPGGDRPRAARAAREVAGSRRSAAQLGAAAVGSLPHRDRFHPQPLRGATSRSCARNGRQPRRRRRRSSRKPKRSPSRPTGARPPRASQELQTAWQETRPGAARRRPRSRRSGSARRCNTFFARRREDLTTRKKIWTDNLAKKEALCERAEALVESTDWDAASAEMKRLQSEWKTIGPVRRNKSEVVWKRFRAAADQFFERYHNRHQIALAGKLAEREALVVELEALAAAENGDVPGDLAARVQQLRTTWNRSVPIPGAEMRPLTDRWQAALTQIVDRQRGRVQRHGPRSGRGPPADGEAHRAGRGVPRTTSGKRRPVSRRPSCSPRGCGPRSRPTRWAAAPAKTRSGARPPTRSRKRSRRGSGSSPVAGPDARALETRFRDACRRVMDHARRQSTAGGRRPARPTAIGA